MYRLFTFFLLYLLFLDPSSHTVHVPRSLIGAGLGDQPLSDRQRWSGTVPPELRPGRRPEALQTCRPIIHYGVTKRDQRPLPTLSSRTKRTVSSKEKERKRIFFFGSLDYLKFSKHLLELSVVLFFVPQKRFEGALGFWGCLS